MKTSSITFSYFWLGKFDELENVEKYSNSSEFETNDEVDNPSYQKEVRKKYIFLSLS